VYAALWRVLPGGKLLKSFCCLVLAVGVVVLLFTVVFPWAEPRLPFTDVTVEDSSSTVGASPAWSTAGGIG
jgi:hypothetical protein